MSNREIDRKIAELLGYTVRPWIVVGTFLLASHEVHWSPPAKDSEEEAWEHCPEFTSDWNAMRLLVEWLQDKKLRVELDFLFKDEATVQLSQLKGYGWSVIIEYASNYAETAPLALCNAVLALPTELLGPKAIESNE